MSRTRAVTVELPEEMADYLAAKVRSGEYESESDVVLDGLFSLIFEDKPDQAQLDRWIENEVMPTLEAVEADPSLLIPLEEARRQLHDHIDHFDDRSHATRP